MHPSTWVEEKEETEKAERRCILLRFDDGGGCVYDRVFGVPPAAAISKQKVSGSSHNRASLCSR